MIDKSNLLGWGAILLTGIGIVVSLVVPEIRIFFIDKWTKYSKPMQSTRLTKLPNNSKKQKSKWTKKITLISAIVVIIGGGEILGWISLIKPSIHLGEKITLFLKNPKKYPPDTIDNGLKKYRITQKIKEGSVYIDDVIGIVIGVQEIDYKNMATFNITFPDNSNKKEQVGAGKIFLFHKQELEYQLIITKINRNVTLRSNVEIQIIEK